LIQSTWSRPTEYFGLIKGGYVLNYIKKPDVTKNNLKKKRIELGLTITALSKLANVSTKVISQTERMLVDPTRVTKSKIVNGLNAEQLLNGEKWKYEDIFPNKERNLFNV
jgi:DNA-binding XRE family transcriptional regulator